MTTPRTWPEGTMPTAAQWLPWFEEQTADDRLVIASTMLDAAHGYGRCVELDHDGQLRDTSHDLWRAIEATDRARTEERERILNAVRKVHNAGDDAVLAPGKWCAADGDEWPCPTMRALAALTDEGGDR
jgi:hypothetical protein